jgi:hypothetical protein
MYGPNQVGELIIGNANATQTTIQTFIASAPNQSIKALSFDGTAPAAGIPFNYYQKTAGNAAKGLNYEFSDTIIPANVELCTLATYAAEVQKLVTYTVGTATSNTTYEAELRIYNDGGSLSPENFAVVQGVYVTAPSGDTTTTIKDGLVLSLQKNIQRRGNFEVVVTSTGANTFTVAALPQTVVPGKIIGKQIEFDAIGKSYPNAFDVTQITQNIGNLTVVTTTLPYPGKGTGKWAQNYEWFVKGYKYEVYRQTGYPADFNTPYYANPTGVYNVINLKYFSQRKETSVERQYKSLTIAIDKGTDTNPNNVQTNAVLTDLRTILGSTIVPAALPIV